MRIAIFSDIHGNLEALEAAFADAKQRGYDHMVCLGDIVGYGADPQRCVDLIREEVWKHETGEMVVRGNHDDAASGGDDGYFNREAQKAVRWTHEQLTDPTLEWLKAIPMAKSIDSDILLVHSSPEQPAKWNYVVSMADAFSAFQNFTERFCFVGHSHVPFHVGVTGNESEIQVIPSEAFELHEKYRYLSNVGSIGQPRDGDWRASYVMLDLGKGTLERIRLEYDVEGAAEKIRKAGLPEFLADRLFRGR